jgi:hypothetical protein
MLLIVASAGVCIAIALLKAWNDWLDLKRFELSAGRPAQGSSFATARIELADLKERVRRLEAISDGIDPATWSPRLGGDGPKKWC